MSVCEAYFILYMVVLRYYTIHPTVVDYIVYERIVSVSVFLSHVSLNTSVYPVIAFTRITLHFVSARVILGFGPGPAFCPLSDSGKGALGGATPSAFWGGANRAVCIIIPSELEAYL